MHVSFAIHLLLSLILGLIIVVFIEKGVEYYESFKSNK